MRVDFWLDPGCPFCWVTSRWLVDVAGDRDLDIHWRSISLLMKNDLTPDNPYFEPLTRTHGILRVMEALRADGQGDSIAPLYEVAARRMHHEGDREPEVTALLQDAGLDPGFAAAADDASWDGALRSSLEDALRLVGDDVGTPIVAIGEEGEQRALFGPVITAVPAHQDGLALWDALVTLARMPEFYELKRTRSTAPTMPEVP